MVTIQDLTQNEIKSLDEYFQMLVSNYLANEPGTRRQAVKMYDRLDAQQHHEFIEWLKDGSFPYPLANEVEEFLINNSRK